MPKLKTTKYYQYKSKDYLKKKIKMDQTDSVSIHYTDEEYLLSGQNYSNLYSMFSLFNYSVVCTLKIIYI